MKNCCLIVGVGFVIGILGGCASSGGDDLPAEPAAVRTASDAAPDQPADEPLVNTLKWTTASEVDNFGFDIFRGLSEDGPFEKITTDLLPGAGTTDEPQNYVFVDESIDPSRDYFYYIESISLGGVREQFSPVIRSPAKKPAEASQG
jgi:hypothetical protein